MSKRVTSSSCVAIRPATLKNLEGIMEVEREEFGERIGEEAMAATITMADRINRCNTKSQTWFWVALVREQVVGYMVAQPTDLTPESCTSWGQATDEGTMKRTFALNGRNIYIVSLGVKGKAPAKTGSKLIEESVKAWKASGKQFYMFCSRMPGYRALHTKTSIDPDLYWRRRDERGGPEDGMLNWFWRIFRSEPVRLLLNGFPPDQDSGGHGVLFAVKDPDAALKGLACEIASLEAAEPHKKEVSDEPVNPTELYPEAFARTPSAF